MGRRQVNRRGAATVEAVLALLVFIIIWTGVLYIGKLYAAQLEANERARRCAWLISVRACRSVPDGCSRTSSGGSGGEGGKRLREQGKDVGDSSALAEAVIDPLLDQLEKVFGERTTAHAGSEVTQPELLGGGEVQVGASYSLPCNTKPVNVESLAELFLQAAKDLK